jgi:exodeoxyribonuclease-5
MLLTCEQDYELIHGKATFPLKATDEDEVQRNIITCQALFEEHFARQSGYVSADKRDGYEAKKKHHLVDWAWALTCHSSQGSQWNKVVVHDEGSSFREDIDRWRYTAVTRAAEKLTVVI